MTAFSKNADIYDGHKLLTICRDYVDASDNNTKHTIKAANIGLCAGYIRGFLEGYTTSTETANFFYKRIHPNDRKSFMSLPWHLKQSVSLDQIIRAVVDYLHNNPNELNKPSVILIQRAMLKEFTNGV